MILRTFNRYDQFIYVAILIAEWVVRATSLYVIQFVLFWMKTIIVPMVRASPDNVSNGRGVKLLDLCLSTNVRIVNGRIGQTDKYT